MYCSHHSNKQAVLCVLTPLRKPKSLQYITGKTQLCLRNDLHFSLWIVTARGYWINNLAHSFLNSFDFKFMQGCNLFCYSAGHRFVERMCVWGRICLSFHSLSPWWRVSLFPPVSHTKWQPLVHESTLSPPLFLSVATEKILNFSSGGTDGSINRCGRLGWSIQSPKQTECRAMVLVQGYWFNMERYTNGTLRKKWKRHGERSSSSLPPYYPCAT